MQDACIWQYNNSAAIASYSNWLDPDSWFCFVNSGGGNFP